MNPRDAKSWYNYGLARFYEKDYAAAADACEKALAFDSKFAEAWNLLGKIHYNQGNNAKALNAFETAIQHDPNLAIAWKNLALIDYDKKMFQKAIDSCNKSVALDPALTQGWFLLGLCHQAGKEPNNAIRAFLAAVKCNPKLTQAWIYIGIERAKVGEIAGAAEAFEKAVELEPENADAWHNLMLMKKTSGDRVGYKYAREKEQLFTKKQKMGKKLPENEETEQAEQVVRQAVATQLLEANPRTAEEAMNLLQKQQREIDRLLGAEQYAQAITFIEGKDKTFQAALKLFREIGITTLVPTLENEQKKNLDLLYEVNHNLWAEKYNTLSTEISTLQDKKDFVHSTEKIQQVLTLLHNRIQEAEKRQHPEDSAKLSKLKAEFENLLKTNSVVATYERMEEFYNEILRKIENRQLTEAMKQIPNLILELEKLKTSIQPDLGRNQTLASVLGPIQNLSAQATRLNTRIESEFAAILKGASTEAPMLTRVVADIHLPEITKIALSTVKTPLYAKVVLLGESSVGKTHLVLSATGQEYSPLQGSTVGVDKYFKPVKIEVGGYDPQLCFWDLGGQWNFRAINELFLNEASAVLLVYDVTRPDTFQNLQYWIDLVKQIRGPSKDHLFIIGNKLDVGGNAVPESELGTFLNRNGLVRIYYTSAKSGEGIARLMEDLAGSIDWSALIRNVDPRVVSAIGSALKDLRVTAKVMRLTDLLNHFASLPGVKDLADPLLLKVVLRQYATQEIIQFGRSDLFIVLDPEFLGKWVAKLLSNAARAEGVVNRENNLKTGTISINQLDLLFQYLENEKICYALRPGTWVFPNVLHKGEPSLDDSIQLVLNSAPQTVGFRIKGPGDLIFSRLTVTLARELGVPAFASNVAGVWIHGQSIGKTAVLLQFIPALDGGVIRVKAGGGRGVEVLAQIQEIARQVFAAYTSEVILI